MQYENGLAYEYKLSRGEREREKITKSNAETCHKSESALKLDLTRVRDNSYSNSHPSLMRVLVLRCLMKAAEDKSQGNSTKCTQDTIISR